MTKHCVNCGTVLPDENTRFCSYCNADQLVPANSINPDSEMVDCPRCHGSGFVNAETTSKRRKTTLRSTVGSSCPLCFGSGTLSQTIAADYRRASARNALIRAVAVIIFMLIFATVFYFTFLSGFRPSQ